MDLFLNNPAHRHALEAGLEARSTDFARAMVRGRSASPHAANAEKEHETAQRAYRCELEYDAHRVRRRKFVVVLRALLLIVAIPAAVSFMFVASYAVTCILDGATPEELIQALSLLFEQVHEMLADAIWGISTFTG